MKNSTLKIETYQELDAFLKLIIKSINDGFFDCQRKETELGFVDLFVNLSCDDQPPVFLDMFYNGLCTNYFNSYDVELVTLQEDYDSAKECLNDWCDFTHEKGYCTCFEDVLLQVLSDGNIVFEDHYQGMRIELGLIDVAENFLKAFNNDPSHFIELVMEHANGGSDGTTYDCWLQMATYGEVIYG